LAAISKGKLAELYQTHYPPSRHKLSKDDLQKVQLSLDRTYVDDLLTGVTPEALARELSKPTFIHPKGFLTMRLDQQADWLSIALTLKALHVLDFCNYSVKIFQSSSLWVQQKLNKDPRLVCNQKEEGKPARPNPTLLEQEILSARAKTLTSYTNTEPADHPVTCQDDYFFLGVCINQRTDTLSLRSKPLMIRTRLKGKIDVICRNVSEFASYLKLNKFHRANVAGLVNNCYYPTFTLNSVYCAVAKKIQSHVLEPDMKWSAKIDSKHFPLLIKLVKLYFLIQHIRIPRYNLLAEKIENLQIYLIAFSDGSADFSAAVLYLLSRSKVSGHQKVQLLTTGNKLHNMKTTKSSTTSEYSTVPINETIGASQGSSLLLKGAQGLTESGFKIEACLLFIDALSVILGLQYHPVKYESGFRKHLADINTNLYHTAILSNQKKEQIPLFLNQKVRVNFADWLTKFNLNDSPEKWAEIQKRLLQPSWLLQDINIWLPLVKKESDDKILIQKSGGIKDFSGENNISTDSNDHLIEVSSVILVDQHVINISNYPTSNWDMIQKVTMRFMTKSPKITFRIFGFVTMICHRWRDICAIKRYKRSRPFCGHDFIFCPCSLSMLETDTVFERPFDPTIELQTIKVNNETKFAQVPWELDNLLINIGLKVMTVLCSDITNKPRLPRILSNFTISKMYFNTMFSYILSGRTIKWGQTHSPQHHLVRVLERDSPLMALMVEASHRLLGCNRGMEKYQAHIMLSGFTCVNLIQAVKDHAALCKRCPVIKAVMSRQNADTRRVNQQFRAPDHFISMALSEDILSQIQLDELGPIDVQAAASTVKVWILVCAELVTRRIYLIPLERQNTVCFMRALEILQARRGKISTMHVDQHSSHPPVINQPPTDDTPRSPLPFTLSQTLNEGGKHMLRQAGLQIVVAEGERHSYVGVAENLIFGIKKCMMHLFSGKRTIHGLFDLTHRLYLIEAYLNDRPTYALTNQICTANTFETASLRFSQGQGPIVISHLPLPKTTEIQDALYLMSQESKRMLTEIATDLSKRLLNYANLTSHHMPKIGTWILIPDRLLYKSMPSWSHAIGRVIEIHNRSLLIKLPNGKTIDRAIGDIVPCNTNRHQQLSLDPLDLPLINDSETVQYRDIVSQFNLFLPSITLGDEHPQSLPSDEPTVPTVLQDTSRPQDTEILVDHTFTPEVEPPAATGDTVDHVPGDTYPLQVRRSTRNKRPTWRYRENYADFGNDSDIE